MTLQIQLAIAALVAALSFGGGWAVNGWRGTSKVADCKTEQAQGVATRAEAARANESNTAQLESKHAQDTIYNADRLAALKTGIAVDVRSELERAHRLQLSADSRAATYRAQAEADATARRALADKASALDRQLAEGVGVVAELGGALKQRDAEVAALCDQVNIERGLNGDEGDQACRGS
ncbi:putative membrane protein YqiK [Comamonas odontotermitis]|uniref:Membrane protein YqiK n=1 Tax=Comamonas odontotermitis TaxID=379895 RepID=A0ABR6RFS6_9BURK|nr:hypothetical protein [Comamonas odontotermitis]MBB6578020.1 putative membrane protein YqiK [Comamonas odontotermitis]